jgi:hypothetical protein
LLLAWEKSLRCAPAARPLTILGALGDDTDPKRLEQLSIGRRDAELLELRAEAFGDRLDAVADCSACGETLELSIETSELRPSVAPSDREWHVLTSAGFEVRFRLPTTADLVAVVAEADVAHARATLLERCVLDPPVEALPDDVRGAIVERMAELDPFATVELELVCPACGEVGSVGLDMTSFLWAELDAAARRTLEDVHLLASAYGWREGEVLALSPERRRAYLELVG